MLFFKSKSISHRQAAMIGFVLAVLSLLTTAMVVFIFPLFGAWLNTLGVYQLDVFLLACVFVVFCAIQGLLLFGFPLYYAQDKKSHMTGFRILCYSLMWMVAMVLLVGLLLIPMSQPSAYNLQDLQPTEESITVPSN